MNITKKKTALLALALVAIFLAGMVVASVVLPPRYVYITVEEAISITPDSVEVTLYVGENGTADFTIHNAASVNIPLTVHADVTEFPEGGSAEDLTLTYPETLTAAPGDNTLTIDFSLATGAVPGNYTITVNVTRI